MSKEPVIRFAEKADLPGVVRLCELHAEFEKSEYKKAGKEQALSRHLFSEHPALFCLVAEIDGELVGYATYMKQFSTWDACFYVYMDCLYLMEACRGYGIGKKLMERIQQESRVLNCDLIQWQTPDFNQRAMLFYDRLGAMRKSKERYFLEA